MMEKSISYTCFMNVTGFWIVYFECFVTTMSVCFIFEIIVERENIEHQISFKFLYIFSFPFIPNKLFPRLEDIFERNDKIICINKNHTINSTPPPTLLPVLQKVK